MKTSRPTRADRPVTGISGLDPANPDSLLKFRGLLTKVFLKGFLKPEFINVFLDEYLDEFVVAFTHKSVSLTNNMEIYESLGDTVVNACIMRYIKEKFPDIRSVEWLTKLKHLYQSKTWLHKIAMTLGFKDWVRYSNKDFSVFYNIENYEALWSYQSIFEDTCEAFFGCFVVNFIKHGFTFGAGIQIAYWIIWWAFEEHDLDISVEAVFDPVSRLKLAMTLTGGTIERLEGHTWDFDGSKHATKSYDGPVPMYTCTYYGWVTKKQTSKSFYVRGDRKRMIGQATLPDEKQAKQEAAAMAIANLKKHYQGRGKEWVETYKSPYDDDQNWNGFLGSARQKRLRDKGTEVVHYKKHAPPPASDFGWLTEAPTGAPTRTSTGGASKTSKASTGAPPKALPAAKATRAGGRTWAPRSGGGGVVGGFWAS